mgnify:CR=1 FL=1
MTGTDSLQNWPPQAEVGAYGQYLAQSFGVSEAPCLLLTDPPRPRFAITRLCCASAALSSLAPLPRSAAYMVMLYLKPCDMLDVIRQGERLEHPPPQAGSTALYTHLTLPRKRIG